MAKIIWKRIGRTATEEGSTILYRASGIYPNYEIESRKRHIPHANEIGTWDHTTYWVVLDGKDIIERYSLKDAKGWVEAHAVIGGRA